MREIMLSGENRRVSPIPIAIDASIQVILSTRKTEIIAAISSTEPIKVVFQLFTRLLVSFFLIGNLSGL